VILIVDAGLPLPPYEQIRGQIATMVATGVLTAGARLPTIRQLAADLDIAPGTVTRAYRELEQAGDIVSRGRHGTFVAERRRPSDTRRRTLLASAAEQYAVVAAQLGASTNEALDAAQTALAKLE
jgi:DNA-binding transcriptional regulator YhcF (GntR family)